MGNDQMADGTSVPTNVAAGKKKKANRSSKLKQFKHDARRGQWLSQVKGKDDCNVPPPQACDDFDFDSPIRNTAVGNRRGNDSPSTSVSSRSSSMESTSRSISDAEEEEDSKGREEEKGILDDWEAVADALSEEIGSYKHHRPCRHCEPAASRGVPGKATPGGITAKMEPVWSSPRARRLDDASLPQSLLGISNQWRFSLNGDRHYQASQQKGILPLPTSCPICYEVLDLTDSSFLPCSCGFRLCLFCHKRILETDGRCPGCRKQYDSFLGGTVDINMGGSTLLP